MIACRTVALRQPGHPWIQLYRKRGSLKEAADGIDRFGIRDKLSRGEGIRRLLEHVLAELKPRHRAPRLGGNRYLDCVVASLGVYGVGAESPHDRRGSDGLVRPC